MAPGRHTPDPRGARTPAEFLAALQALKERSGLTYRELSSRAEELGDVLPRSTVANMLARTTLPREELLTAFVRACGATPDELTEWRRARTELAGREAYGAAEASSSGGPVTAAQAPETAGAAEATGMAEVPETAGAAEATGMAGAAEVPETAGAAETPEPARAAEATGTEAPAAEPPVASAAPVVGSAAEAPHVAGGRGAGVVAIPDGPGDVPDGRTVSSPPSWPVGEDTVLPPGDASGTPARIRRALVAAVAVTGLVLAGFSVLALLRGGGAGHAGRPSGTPTAAVGAAVAPAAGDVRVRVAGTAFCLGERRGTRSGQVHQVPCAEPDFPRYSLVRAGAGRWRIASDHPDFGPGCSGIPSGGRIPDAAFEDSECGDPGRVESFALEPYVPAGGAVRGYRIVPVGSATRGTCVTVVGDRSAAGARLAQAPCAPDAAGQLFSFERRN
ncbi:helix-turn-helix domain-containing protein [Streptomyces sp. NPDC015492]|uniref:helix-turn-helix domain-containing protein n=1 Tax=Streptomyces sp. NPDC015492 TaxID=3364958 RepID=UPI0036FEB00C